MRKHIPNFITSLNLLTGCAGIYYIAEINFYLAGLFIFIAAAFDFLDGFSARLLKAYSPVGKSLDSLADLVSFGILPGLLMIKLQLSLTETGNGPDFLSGQGLYYYFLILSPLFIPLSSALRLARFDNDPSQSWEFRGLPTPANAIFIAALVWSAPEGIRDMPFIYSTHVIFGLNILLAFLLISPFSFLSLKFKNYKLRDNIPRYLMVVIMFGSVIVWKVAGIAIGMVCYMFISVINGLVKKMMNISPTNQE